MTATGPNQLEWLWIAIDKTIIACDGTAPSWRGIKSVQIHGNPGCVSVISDDTLVFTTELTKDIRLWSKALKNWLRLEADALIRDIVIRISMDEVVMGECTLNLFAQKPEASK